ncbi:MAG TPA: hypothetical protein DEW35_00240 [Ruminococcaceae bacterium]|nr:hypothetical protein [Oscillospiraceae bacterium]
MKNIIGIIMACIMVFAFVSCDTKSTEKADETAKNSVNTTSDNETDASLENEFNAVYGQDPFAVIPGEYTAVGQRTKAVVTSPETDTLKIVITGSGGAAYSAEWTLEGKLDNSLRLTFKNSVLRLLTYDETGEIIEEKTDYTDGAGTVIFDKDAVKFTWNDEKSDCGAVVFVKN